MSARQKETVVGTDLNIGSVPMGDHDADWFVVMARATGASTRVKAASVLGYYVRRRKQEYLLIVQYIANKYGLTFDECFHRLRKNEDLGIPVPDFKVDYEVEALIEKLKNDSL